MSKKTSFRASHFSIFGPGPKHHSANSRFDHSYREVFLRARLTKSGLGRRARNLSQKITFRPKRRTCGWALHFHDFHPEGECFAPFSPWAPGRKVLRTTMGTQRESASHQVAASQPVRVRSTLLCPFTQHLLSTTMHACSESVSMSKSPC